MFAQFFVANLRGEPLLYKDYRGTVGKSSVDVFYSEVIAPKAAQAAPVLNVGGVNFFHVRHAGLYFVLTSADGSGSLGAAAASASYALELLCRAASVVRDFCGVLNEESIRRNVVLANELVDDLLDWGYPQATSTELLRPLVHTAPAPAPLSSSPSSPSGSGGPVSADASDAAVVSSVVGSDAEATAVGRTAAITVEMAKAKVGEVLEKLGGQSPSVMSVAQSLRPATGDGAVVVAEGAPAQRREEIFVDLIERLSAVFTPSGDVASCEVTGSLCVRNFLGGGSGSQEVVISLNGGAIEEFNFHGCVRPDSFAADRVLRMTPPPGETVAMSYRAGSSVDALPFRLFPFVDTASPTKVVTTVKLHADIPRDRHAVNVAVRMAVPKCTANVFCESTAGVTEYRREDCAVVCVLSKIQGGVEVIIRAGITLDRPLTSALKEIGPLDVSFEIPSWTATRLLIRSVSVEDRNRAIRCFRWTRALTLSNSYIRRLG
jgi:AP-4 complex subunit mu-1